MSSLQNRMASFRWDDLRVLLAVHRHGSLAAAARVIGIDASTASRRLRSLEEDLGARLFDRTPDGLAPTGLADRLIPHAEQAEAAALAVSAESAGEDVRPEGHVRVACADALGVYVLAPALPALLDANPGLRVTLMVSTELVDLERREADVAVRFVRPERGDLVARRIADAFEYTGFVSRGYAEARCGSVHVDDVDWIGWSETRAHLQEARLYERLVGRPPRFQSDNLVVMMEAMRAGVGALLLPAPLRDVEPSLVEVTGLETVSAPVATWLVTHRALKEVPRVRLVMDWLTEVMTSEPVPAVELSAGSGR